MLLGKNYKIFKLISGEMVITEIADVTDDGYVLDNPASIVPVGNPQDGGGQQIGFAKLMPFSNSKEEILLDTRSISISSKPDAKLLEAYEAWSAKVKEAESGIIIPNMKNPNIPGDGMAGGKTANFRNLNTALRRHKWKI